jgi:hypothetical protein
MKDCGMSNLLKMWARGTALALWAIGLWAGSVVAQDAHYWDNQYGTRAELLGGLVVGSSSDLSATYYNPGWIALQDAPSLLLTTRAAEVYSIKLKNGQGRGNDPKSTVVTPSPGYLAGRFSPGQDWGWKWAYTYLQKVKFEFNASGLRIDQDPAPGPDGNFWFSGEIFRDSRVSETWYGVTLARKLTDRVAVGFSPYVAQRNHRSRKHAMAQALGQDAAFGSAFLVDEYKYWHVRMLLKMGLAAQGDRWSAGLAVTTPSLGITGSGAVYRNASLSGDYDPNNPGLDPPYLQANTQEDLATTWKSPLSVAGGGSLRLGLTRVHLTAEWFNSIGPYRVLDTAPYAIQSAPGQQAEYTLEYAARNVVNYGFGVDHAFSDKFSLFTSYRADYSTTPDDLDNNLSLAVWNLNHATAGASFQFLSMEFTAGVQFSWGDGLSGQFLNYNADENGDIIARVGDAEVTYNRLKALLGFNLPFAAPGD